MQASFGKVRPSSIFRLRGSNKKIQGKQTPRQVATSPSSAVGTPREERMQSLLESIIGRRSPSTSPPAERRPQLQLENGGQGQKSPIQQPPLPALDNVGVGSRDAVVVKGVDELQPQRPPALIEARLDEMDVQVAKYYHAKALSQREKESNC